MTAPTSPDIVAAEQDAPSGPVVVIPVYAGVSELELGIMVSVCRLCGGEHAIRTVNRSRASIVTAGGLVSTPHVLYAALPEVAALLIPGGPGAAKASRDPLLKAFLHARATLPTGASGSGLLLCGEASTLQGRTVGGPADLADTLWGYGVQDVQPGQVVQDALLVTTPGGLLAWQAAYHVARQVWGLEAALNAVQRLGFASA